MNTKVLSALVIAFFSTLALLVVRAHSADKPTWTTYFDSTSPIEGLTGDDVGNVYTADRGPGGGAPCKIWKVDTNLPGPNAKQVGQIVQNATFPCRPSGLAFGPDGKLYITTSATGVGIIWRLTPNDNNPALPSATGEVFATGVEGANGVAFDKAGNLWVSDGTTGVGRVWRIPNNHNPGNSAGNEFFRIQPMRNSKNVGRLDFTCPQCVANPVAGAQPLVANGLAFNTAGDLYVADTARGAIWRVEFKQNGMLKSKTGCDQTFSNNTLCMENVWITHPLLDGTDGIALDQAGNIWNSVNERNAIVIVTPDREVVEFFRNDPDSVTGLRNEGPLELPTSPFLTGTTLCTTNSDGGRRDNNPSSPGEGPKVNCLDQALEIQGLPLPIQ